MNANAKQWVAAMRSGEYEQGGGHLRSSDDLYCPLGVLCQLYYNATGKLEPEQMLKSGPYYFGAFSSYLPDEVSEWAGLTTRYGDFEEGDIIGLSDDDLASLSEIADFIESEPPGLFV